MSTWAPWGMGDAALVDGVDVAPRAVRIVASVDRRHTLPLGLLRQRLAATTRCGVV